MGLDVVEIVLRVEETFGVDLPNDELGSVATVGDLYQLLLSRLDGDQTFYPASRLIAPVPAASRPANTILTNSDAECAQKAAQSKTREEAEVGRILKQIIVDQLQIKPEEVVPEAHFGRDLGVD
jgi:acyl carrier protein